MVPFVMTWLLCMRSFERAGVGLPVALSPILQEFQPGQLRYPALATVLTAHHAYILVIVLLTAALIVSIRRNSRPTRAPASRTDFGDINFRSKFDKMLEGVEIISFKWEYLYVNEAYERQVRTPRDQLIGYTIMEKFPGIEQTDIYDAIERCFEERIPIHLVDSFTFPDNVTRWFEISFQPVPEGVFILSNDITEYKTTEEALRNSLKEVLDYKERNKQSEKIYKTIASSIPGSTICLIDRDLRYFLIEGDMLAQLGSSREALLGSKIFDAVATGPFRAIASHIQRVFNGEAFTIENAMGELDTLAKYVPLRNDEGDVFAAMVVVFDVSELKNAQRALSTLNTDLEGKIQERTAELETVNRELEAFSYSVAHDLRTPLRAIYGYSVILDEDYGTTLADEGRRLIARVVDNAKRMGTLIDDLLTFSRLGRKEIQRSHVDMKDIVESCIADLNLAEGYPGTIVVGDLHPVMADPSLIKYVMINLLGNAVKYSSRQDKPSIVISSEKTDTGIIYAVRDNGVGFDMEYADKLFGVFQRLHSSDEFEGTGVGLAFVQRIVHRHHGKVWAEGKVNKGATFYVSLPCIVSNQSSTTT